MPMRGYEPAQVATLLRKIEVRLANGKSAPQAIRDAQITRRTFSYDRLVEAGGVELNGGVETT